jgi:glycosyltransferase involved in cell wall biosynthesis
MSLISRSEVTAFLLNSLHIGGSEVKTVQLANQLKRRHHSVHILYLNPPDTLRNRLEPGVSAACLERVGKFSIPALLRLREYVRLHGVTTIVAINLYPLVYSTIASKLATSTRLRTIVTVNTSDHRNTWNRMQMTAYGPLLRQADHLVFGSRVQMEKWVAGHDLRQSACEVIYNGVDVGRFSVGQVNDARESLRNVLGLASDDLVIGTVGRLAPEKNHQQLISAVKQLADGIGNLKALIVGEGPERPLLEARIESEGLRNRVVLCGALDDVRPALELIDIFVLPSVAVETFSNAALEAMAMERCVLLSDVGGAREMIVDGESGRICRKGDVDSLTASLSQLTESRAERARLGQNARNRVSTEFSMDAMIRRFEVLLNLE